jgi:multidrug resistance protein, MATE family
MLKAKNSKDLQMKSSYQEILGIALPIAAAIVVPQFNFVINNIFLGTLGEKALGLAGLTGIYYLIFAVIGMGFSNGVRVLISRRAGENNLDEIGKLFYQGAIISIVIALLGLLFTYVFAGPLLAISLKDSSNFLAAFSFLKIRIWGLFFLYLYQLGNTLLVGTNNSRLLIIGTLIETLVNIFFDYVLIYGKFGFPQLGFNGAAYASLIAEFSGFIVIYLVLNISGINNTFKLFEIRSLDISLCKLILKQSSPLIIQYAVSIISWEYFYILVEHYGALELAISNTMRNILGLFGCFTWAFSATTNTMVSNLIGQGRQDAVMKLVWRISQLSALFALISCALIILNLNFWLGIYGQGEGFITAAIPVLKVVLVGLFITSFSTIWMNAVIGTGHTKTALLAELLAVLVYSVYNYIVLEQLHLSLLWGWAGEWIYWIVLFIPCFSYMRKGKWMKSLI